MEHDIEWCSEEDPSWKHIRKAHARLSKARDRTNTQGCTPRPHGTRAGYEAWIQAAAVTEREAKAAAEAEDRAEKAAEKEAQEVAALTKGHYLALANETPQEIAQKLGVAVALLVRLNRKAYPDITATAQLCEATKLAIPVPCPEEFDCIARWLRDSTFCPVCNEKIQRFAALKKKAAEDERRRAYEEAQREYSTLYEEASTLLGQAGLPLSFLIARAQQTACCNVCSARAPPRLFQLLWLRLLPALQRRREGSPPSYPGWVTGYRGVHRPSIRPRQRHDRSARTGRCGAR